MTLAQLKATCAAYHQKEVADLTENGVDLFLEAANSVRTSAESLHNFEASRVRATLSLAGANGGSLSDATIVPADSRWAGIATIVAVSSVTANGFERPLNFSRKDVALEQDRLLDSRNADFWSERYPSDAQFEYNNGGAGIVQVGNSLFIYPYSTTAGLDSVPIYIEGYARIADYTAGTLADAAYVDHFTSNGYGWLKWSIIHELNYFFRTFVPRQEGNIASVRDRVEEEWRKFVLWDTYLIDPNATNLS